MLQTAWQERIASQSAGSPAARLQGQKTKRAFTIEPSGNREQAIGVVQPYDIIAIISCRARRAFAGVVGDGVSEQRQRVKNVFCLLDGIAIEVWKQVIDRGIPRDIPRKGLPAPPGSGGGATTWPGPRPGRRLSSQARPPSRRALLLSLQSATSASCISKSRRKSMIAQSISIVLISACRANASRSSSSSSSWAPTLAAEVSVASAACMAILRNNNTCRGNPSVDPARGLHVQAEGCNPPFSWAADLKA
mmetsp:Transcript_130629/g.418884  ORF Transcript_130629/g.418884 Transcript_130629/m.418884 type:complete len:249 (+) Transcript_130629:1857-2603(+)